MNFNSVSSIMIPAGEVFSIHSGDTLLWQKQGAGPQPTDYPANNEVWYRTFDGNALADSALNFTPGVLVSQIQRADGVWVATFSDDVTSPGGDIVFKETNVVEVWCPDTMYRTRGDFCHSCIHLTDLHFGAGLYLMSNGTCSGGTPLEHIHWHNNNYFYNNNTGAVLKSNNNLLLGTKNLDIRDTPCEVVGSRCMADMPIAGCTLYFPGTVTSFAGDYNIGSSVSPVFTAYFYSVVAPTVSSIYNIRCGSGTTIHIPAGSLTSYQQAWSSLSLFTSMTFVEDL